MTLELLNPRHLKLIRKMSVIGVLLAIVILLSTTHWSAAATAFIDAQKLTASDGAQSDIFGEKVAISGSTAVVSARVDDNLRGAVYVFHRHAGTWIETQKLTASDGTAGDQFGSSVAISGSIIVVGASFDDVGGNDLQGSVYVFERHGGSWVETQKLTASDGARGDFFGGAVAVSGSTIVVGVPDNNSAYVFNRHGGSWIETQKLTANNATADVFGVSVAVSGSTIVVGASFDDVGSNINQGAAYVFERRGGSWVESQRLTASDGAPFDTFGNPVAISGSSIVVGVPFDTVGDNFAQGSAYVFNRHGGGWVETQKLTASDGVSADLFGFSIAVSDSTIVVGAPLDDVGGNRDQGSAYVFNRHGGNWVETERLTAIDGTVFDSFGNSVAVSGRTVVVGTPFIDIGPNVGQGSVYVFEL